MKKEIEKQINDILVELTNKTGYDHSNESLDAFTLAEVGLIQLLEQSRQEIIKEIEKWIEEISKNPKITNVGEIFFELSKLKSKLQNLKDEK